MNLCTLTSLAVLGTVIAVSAAHGAENPSPVFHCIVETEFEALNPGLPESGIIEPIWDAEFLFDTATGMFSYNIQDEPGYDAPRRWDIIQEGSEGADWIAVYHPELGPPQNSRVNDVSMVLRIRAWRHDLVPNSEIEQNRFYLLRYDVLGVGNCTEQ
jgi:hypothetical protein